MMRISFLLAVLLFFASAAHSQESEQQGSRSTISELLEMGGEVINANNDYVWILLTNQVVGARVLFLCLYDVDRPNAKSYCVPIT